VKRVRVVVLLAFVATAVALPTAALAQTTNPLSPLEPSVPQATPTTSAAPPVAVQTTTTSGSSTLSGSSAIVIAIGALVLIAGISFFIWYDARRRAPVRHRTAEFTAGGREARPGTKSKPKPRKPSPAERRRRKRGRAK
jgi:hypothetical protein